MSLDSTEIFQEGLIIPPVKLYQAGQLNQPLYKFILNNSRYPEMIQGDLDAEIAACRNHPQSPFSSLLLQPPLDYLPLDGSVQLRPYIKILTV